jgi:parallel beta-helix repeat protein
LQTIAAALAQARAGDTIRVMPGEYSEQIALKSGVTVLSWPPGSVTLRASPLTGGPAVTAFNIGDARLAGFRILADTQAPLSAGIVLTGSVVEIEEVEIAGAGVGIEIRGATAPTLRANTIRDCSDIGILISDFAQPVISHNAIRGNKSGLVVRDGARPVLVDNVFEKNGVELPPEMALDAVRAHNFFIDVKSPRPPAAPGRGLSTPRAGRAASPASPPEPARGESKQP